MIHPQGFRACVFGTQALFLALLSALFTTAAPAAEPIVLVTVGALRADVLEHPDAFPVLTSLAERSVRFDFATTPSPQPLPAVASVLTGLLPRDHTVVDAHTRPLPESVETLAERLSANGWATAAFPGDALIHDRSGLLRGFTDVDRFSPTRVVSERADSAAAAIGRLDDTSAFVWVDFSAAAGLPPWARLLPTAEVEEHRYRIRLHVIDTAIGTIADALDALEAYTLVVVGTHGYTLAGESGIPGSGLDLAEGSLRVPLLVAGPGITPRRVGTAVSTIEVAPTLAVLAGAGDDVTWSLAPALAGAAVDKRFIFHETDVSRLTGWPVQVAVRRGSKVLRRIGSDSFPALPAPALTSALDERYGPATGPSGVTDVQHDAIDAVFRGRSLVSSGRFEEATTYLDSLAVLHPDNLFPGIELGLLFTFLGQEDNAALAFERGLTNHADWVEMNAAYLESLLRFARHDVAIARLESVESTPMYDSYRLWAMGAFHVAAQRFTDALDVYREALDIGPPPTARWERFWEAGLELDSYAAEIQAEPRSYHAHMEMGKLFGDLEMYVDAYRLLHKARGFMLAPSEADYWLGHYLLREQRPQHAIASFRRAVEWDPESAATWSEFGLARLQMGEVDSAFVAFDTAVKTGNADPVTQYNYACLLARDGRVEDALTWLGNAVDAGYGNHESITFDPDLDPLRSDPRFEALVARTR